MMHQRSVKAQISIENLLVWAFQREKAKLYDVSGLDVTAGYPEDSTVRAARNNVLGGFITGSAPGARVVRSDIAEDAEIVAEAVMQLRPWPLANLVWSYATVGARPDWKPHARHHWRPAKPNSDLEVGEVVPPWERPKSYRRLTSRNAVGKWVRDPLPRWCEVVDVDAPEVIDAYRRQYLEWVDLLEHLRARLDGRLHRWDLTHELPPRRPWR